MNPEVDTHKQQIVSKTHVICSKTHRVNLPSEKLTKLERKKAAFVSTGRFLAEGFRTWSQLNESGGSGLASTQTPDLCLMSHFNKEVQ